MRRNRSRTPHRRAFTKTINDDFVRENFAFWIDEYHDIYDKYHTDINYYFEEWYNLFNELKTIIEDFTIDGESPTMMRRIRTFIYQKIRKFSTENVNAQGYLTHLLVEHNTSGDSEDVDIIFDSDGSISLGENDDSPSLGLYLDLFYLTYAKGDKVRGYNMHTKITKNIEEQTRGKMNFDSVTNLLLEKQIIKLPGAFTKKTV